MLGRLQGAFEESDLPITVDVLDWHSAPESFREVIESDYTVVSTRVGEDREAERWQPARIGRATSRSSLVQHGAALGARLFRLVRKGMCNDGLWSAHTARGKGAVSFCA